MRELATIDSGQLLASGIYPGLLADAAPLWTDGKNVVFENGGVRKVRGLLGLGNLSGTPTGLRSAIAAGERRCFVGVGDKAYGFRTGDGLTEIGSFASAGGIYQFLPWDTWCLISNGSDPVELWQNAGTSAAITAPFNRANVLFGYQLQAFVGGTDTGGTVVEWSPINNVTDWTQTLTGSAGQLRLRELESDIVAAKPLSGSVGIYSRSQGGFFTYTGSTNPYRFRNPIGGVGAISPYSIVSDGVKHYGIRPSGAFVTDLVGVAIIDQPAMRRYVEENVNWDRQAETYGWWDEANNLARWALPALAGGFVSIGYRTDNGNWTRFEDDVLAGEASGPFDDMIVAKVGRLLRQDKTSVNNDVSAMPAFVRTKPLDLGARNNLKRISKLSFKGEWSGDVNVKLGNSASPNGPVTWVSTFPLVNDVYPDREGLPSEFHYLSIEIESTALNADWTLAGASIYGETFSFVD